MNRTNYAELEDAVFRELQLTPSQASDTDRASVAGFVTREMARCWKWGKDWAEWCPVIEITGVAQWSDLATYALNAVVWYSPDGLYYKALGAVAAGVIPPDNPLSWNPVDAPIYPDTDIVFGLFKEDPRQLRCTPRLDFVLTPSGAYAPKMADGQPVWLHYRPSPPVFSAVAWDGGAVYAPGARVRYGDECYAALQATVPGDTPGASDKWALQPVPADFTEYLVSAVAGRFLRQQGQYERAGGYLSDAEMQLIRAYDRIGAYARTV